MTEGAPSVMTRYDEIPDGPPKRVSSGYVLPGCKHRVVDPETGRVVPRGTAGELCMGGSLVIREYWTGSLNKDTSDSFAEDEQGKWVKTGDQAIMDEDGSIEIVGRYKHLIIRGKCSRIISSSWIAPSGSGIDKSEIYAEHSRSRWREHFTKSDRRVDPVQIRSGDRCGRYTR